MSDDLHGWYERILQQMAAEAYFEGVHLSNNDAIRDALRQGNNRRGFDAAGFTRFTDVQAQEFLGTFQIIAQASDYPDPNRTDQVFYAGTNILANTGMSVTLIQKRGTNEFTLAIRSTEFRTVTDGGDRDRDVWGADINGITKTGFALAQLSALEDYFSSLKASGALPAGSILNVTGYSLGGHLATVFTEIHANDSDVLLNRAFTFNGAGRGTWSRNASDPGAIVAYYKSILTEPELAAAWAAGLATDDPNRLAYEDARALRAAGVAYDPISIYNDRRHQWAEYAAQQQFGLSWVGLSDQGSSDLRNGAAVKITQLYGKEFPFESTGVANSGVHGPATGVFVEAQPLLEIAPDTPSGATDFGNAHALVLIADSLAVMRLYQMLDTTATLELLNRLFSAASNQRVQSGAESKAEGDPLENMLDALRKLFLGSGVERTAYKPGGSGFGDFDFRNTFYDNVDQLTTNAQFAASALQQVQFSDLTVLTAAEMLAAAQGDIAYRYALKELNPFAILEATALYGIHNTQGKLDRYDPAGSTPAGMTPEYLADRAAMLSWLMFRNTTNAGDVFASQVTGPVQFTDLVKRGDDKQTSFRIVPAGSINPADLSPDSPTLRRFVFGTDGAEPISGGPASDGLYGGLGTDVLNGKESNDHLEGGAGLDLYQYGASTGLISSGNDGDDTIRDTDGKGVLHYTYTQTGVFSNTVTSTVIADASDPQPDGTWRNADGRFTYTPFPNAEGRTDLVVTINGDAGGSLTLKDFRDGDFAIRLRGRVGPPAGPVRTFYGDKQDWDSDPNQDGIQPEPDGFGNFIRADGQNGRPDIADANRLDALFGSAAAEVERFTAAGGNDIVMADGPTGATGGADLVEAGDGRDIIWAGPGDDFTEGGADGVSTEMVDGQNATEAGGDVVNAGAGDDALYGWSHAELPDAIRNAETDVSLNRKGDFLSSWDGDDRLVGATENDALLGGDGQDVLVGGAGDDDLLGDLAYGASALNWRVIRTVTPQDDTVLYQLAFENVLPAPIPAGAADALYGGAGVDWSFGGGGDDFIDAGSGDDAGFGEAGADILVGGAGNDFLVGDSGPGGTNDGGDYLDGGAGNDTLQGDGGDDVLIGGPGVDVMDGGAGKDIYVFNRGDGTETVFDTADNDPANAAERSIVIAGDGINRDNVTFRTGSLVIDFGPSDPNDPGAARDTIHFEGFDQVNPANTPLIGEIRFSDGVSMTYADILAQGFDVVGTEGDDDGHDAAHPQLVGTGVTDRISGLGGDDLLVGLAGDDALDGGDGIDELQGGDGNDGLLAGAGADRLFGEAGSDTLSGGDGSDALVGGSDADTLGGDAGADSIWGAAGADTISGGDDDDGLDGGDDADTLAGDAGADSLWGGAGDDTLSGGQGDDMLQGDAGNDTYRFFRADGLDLVFDQDATAGNADRVEFASDISPDDVSAVRGQVFVNDLVLGINGTADELTIANQFVAAEHQVEEIRFADGTVWTPTTTPILIRGTASNNSLVGTSGPNTFEGLQGSDTLTGGAGNDTYRFFRGDGQDTIVDSDSTAGNFDRILYAADILPADVQVSRSGDNLVLKVAATADQVTAINYFANDGATPYSIEQIQFRADGTIWDVNTVKQLVLAGTSGNDTLIGYATDDTLAGLGGNDSLIGNAGADTLDGGTGNDTLQGGIGNDLYLLAREDGQDTITDSDSTAGNVDILRYTAEVLPSEVKGTRSGNNLVLTVTGVSNQVTVTSYFENDGATPYSLERIEFLLDDTVWDVDTVKSMVVTPSSGDDAIVGYATADALHGLDGNDTIRGAGGNDTLDGGQGIDSLYGEGGADTYIFGRGSGQETIVNADFDAPGTIDVMWFGADIAPSQVSATRAGNDLVLSVTGTSDQVQLRDYFLGDTAYVEEIRFADGTVWTATNFSNLATLNGTAGNDLLQGGGFSEFINGLAGNDTLRGGGGNDTIDGGKGLDYVYGEAGNDVIASGTGDSKNAKLDNYLFGGAGDDVLLSGGSNLDFLSGEEGNDILIGSGTQDRMSGGVDNSSLLEDPDGNDLHYGAAAFDAIWLGDQNDFAIGGTGTDNIAGDPDFDGIRGRDIVAFNKSDGPDSASGLGMGSTISIGGGTLYSNLSFEVVGSGLRLKTGSGHYVYLSDWYSGGATVSNLQIVIEGTRDYKPTSSNPMNNQKIQVFNFPGLVAAFDSARAAGQNFSVAGNLANYRLWSSDTQAIGGAVAYQYARTGSINALTYDQMRTIISDPGFATAAQPIVVSATQSASMPHEESAILQASLDVSAELLVSELVDKAALTLSSEADAGANDSSATAQPLAEDGSTAERRTDYHFPATRMRDAYVPLRLPIDMSGGRNMPSAAAVSGAGSMAAAYNPGTRQTAGHSATANSGSDLHWRTAGATLSAAPWEVVETEAGVAWNPVTEASRASVLEARSAAPLEERRGRASVDQPPALSDFDAIRSPATGGGQIAPDARAIANEWCRVARDLPDHLARYAEPGFDGSAGFANAVFAAGLIGAASPVVAAIDLSDSGAGHLRPLEGLKEGFRLLG